MIAMAQKLNQTVRAGDQGAMAADPQLRSTPHQFVERHMPTLKALSERPRLGKAMRLFNFREVVLDF